MWIGGAGYFLASGWDGIQSNTFSSNRQSMIDALAYDEELVMLFNHCKPKEYSKSHLEKLYKEKNIMGNLWDNRMTLLTASQYKMYRDTANSIPLYYKEVIEKMSKTAGFAIEKVKPSDLDKLALNQLAELYWLYTLIKGTHNFRNQ